MVSWLQKMPTADTNFKIRLLFLAALLSFTLFMFFALFLLCIFYVALLASIYRQKCADKLWHLVRSTWAAIFVKKWCQWMVSSRLYTWMATNQVHSFHSLEMRIDIHQTLLKFLYLYMNFFINIYTIIPIIINLSIES